LYLANFYNEIYQLNEIAIFIQIHFSNAFEMQSLYVTVVLQEISYSQHNSLICLRARNWFPAKCRLSIRSAIVVYEK